MTSLCHYSNYTNSSGGKKKHNYKIGHPSKRLVFFIWTSGFEAHYNVFCFLQIQSFVKDYAGLQTATKCFSAGATSLNFVRGCTGATTTLPNL